MANLALIALSLGLAQDAFDLQATLRRIEARYNATRTLQCEFEQTVQMAQGRRSSERGTLYLRKPGQMRWEYASPPGKLFLSDAKQIYYVSPVARRVETGPVKGSEDLRAPLAFLLGKLDFARDFSRYEITRRGNTNVVRAFPKSAKSFYEYVEFLPGADAQLLSVSVQAKDGSRMDYAFRNETRNPPLNPALFTFRAPEGYEVVELRATP